MPSENDDHYDEETRRVSRLLTSACSSCSVIKPSHKLHKKKMNIITHPGVDSSVAAIISTKIEFNSSLNVCGNFFPPMRLFALILNF